MKYKEFGSADRETVILLHGGGLSWWNYRDEAEMLRSDHHVILPILDGHADSDRPFTSIEDNAAEIAEFIDTYLGGKVLFIGGLSLGAQILLEMLSQKSDICRYALVESASVIPSALTNALTGHALKSSYGLIKNRSFAKLQFKSLHMNGRFFEDYYRDTCKITRSDMTAFIKANTFYSLKKPISDTTARVRVLAGGKENRGILRSADAIKKHIPGCEKLVLSGLFHGELSLNYPERYVGQIKSLTENE
jgi:pimeloyl-ACP methyl ester carboxylesterase